MTDGDLLTLAWCDNVWCGQVYELREGWGGHCPSCLTLADEHVAGLHVGLIGGWFEACGPCRQEASARPVRRTA